MCLKLNIHGFSKTGDFLKSGFLRLNLGVFVLAVYAILKVEIFTKLHFLRLNRTILSFFPFAGHFGSTFFEL